MQNDSRGSWGSNLGFLLAAIGSAVGLGNIWGFPFKMGKSGGFAFLVVYLLLALFVGFIIMMSELALGRKTGTGVVGAYHAVSKRFRWIGWLGMLAPFMIMSFYSVLGGYCIEYMALNLSNLAFGGAEISTGANLFNAMLVNPFGCAMFTLLFLIICFMIVKGGIKGGIEKFNNVGMPALFIMLVVIILRSVTLPGATEGLKFMFLPGYAVSAGFIESTPSIISVLSTAGGQMFFSLSLAMGAMITYGSYLNKKENLVKNSGVIVVADTLVALMAGLAVIPAAVANGLAQGLSYSEIAAGLSGPSLLFITLQDVFHAMGAAGPLFGVIFYLLVLIAAISSAISLMEVVVTFFLDRATIRGKEGSRQKITLWVSLAILVEAMIVAIDGLGKNGVWVPGQKLFGIGVWNDCWLDFMDCWSEGIAMPLGAMLMALMIGWELHPKVLLPEIRQGAERMGRWLDVFYVVSIRIIVPIAMAFILAGQLDSFFGGKVVFETIPLLSKVTWGYLLSTVLLVIAWIAAATGSKKKT